MASIPLFQRDFSNSDSSFAPTGDSMIDTDAEAAARRRAIMEAEDAQARADADFNDPAAQAARRALTESEDLQTAFTRARRQGLQVETTANVSTARSVVGPIVMGAGALIGGIALAFAIKRLRRKK